MRLTPGVGDDLTAFVAGSQAILKPVSVIGRDLVVVRATARAKVDALDAESAVMRNARTMAPGPMIFIRDALGRTGHGFVAVTCDEELKDGLTALYANILIFLNQTAALPSPASNRRKASTVLSSATPSTFVVRKCRWKAATTISVRAS